MPVEVGKGASLVLTQARLMILHYLLRSKSCMLSYMCWSDMRGLKLDMLSELTANMLDWTSRQLRHGQCAQQQRRLNDG